MTSSDRSGTPTLCEAIQASASVRRYTGEYRVHAHAHAQILVGLHGSLELELDGHSALIDASCGLIVPAGTVHGFLARTSASVLVIDSPPRQALARVRRFAPPLDWPRHLLDNASLIDRWVESVDAAPSVLSRRRLELSTLDTALEGTLHEPWSTARMAALFHMSPQRFHARFLALTAQPPMAWLRRRRLQVAAQWLAAGRTLEATAAQVGYASASALAFALRRDRGMGARETRQQR